MSVDIKRRVRFQGSINYITENAFDVWREHEANTTLDSVPALESALPALIQLNGRYQGRLFSQWLVENLTQEDDYHKQRMVTSALRDMGASAATPQVLDALVQAITQSDDWRLCSRAADAFEDMGAAAATPQVLDTLVKAITQTGDENLREHAADALKNMGAAAATKEVLEALVKAFTQNHNRDLCEKAADALGRMGPAAANHQVLDALMEALTQTDDDGLRLVAALALGNMGPAAITQEVSDTLTQINDSIPKVWDALTQMYDSILGVWQLLKVAAADALEEVCPAAATRGLDALMEAPTQIRNNHVAEAWEAMEASIATHEALSNLVQALTQTSDWHLRVKAVSALSGWYRAKWRLVGPRMASYPFSNMSVLSSGGYHLKHVTELANLEQSPAPTTPSTVSRADRSEIVLMHLEGHTAHEISAALGCSEQDVCHWLERYQTQGQAGLSD